MQRLFAMSTSPFIRALVPLAEGFEEIEAITVIDVLRRAEVHVTVATLGKQATQPIRASRRTLHLADDVLENLTNSWFHAIVLPGGRPGADNLRACEPLIEMIRHQHSEGRLVAAICAAPLVLEQSGVLTERSFTIHPSAAKDLRRFEPLDAPLVVNKNITTAQAAGHAMAFALQLVQQLCGKDKARSVAEGLIAPLPSPLIVKN